jgi:hypothetical protein
MHYRINIAVNIPMCLLSHVRGFLRAASTTFGWMN